MSRTTPEDFLDKVTEEKSFIRFFQILSDDWELEEELEKKSPSSPWTSGALGWQNGSIGTFLDAAAACGEQGLESGPRNQEDNVWARAASIIYGGKDYE